jgi:hypothetical protein
VNRGFRAEACPGRGSGWISVGVRKMSKKLCRSCGTSVFLANRGGARYQGRAFLAVAKRSAWSAAIAQSVEHVIRNDGVGGSNPSCGTNDLARFSILEKSPGVTSGVTVSSLRCLRYGLSASIASSALAWLMATTDFACTASMKIRQRFSGIPKASQLGYIPCPEGYTMQLSKGDAVTYVALVTSAVIMAAEPLRKEAATPPESHPFLSSDVWAYLPIILLSAVGVIWLVRQIRARTYRQDTTARPVPPPQTSPPATVQESEYIRDKDVRVYAGSAVQRLFPRYALKFIRNGKGGQVLVEFSAFVGAGWTQRRTVVLRNLGPFVRDQEVCGPLISADDIDSGIWRWGGASLSPPPSGTVTTVSSQSDNMQLMSRCFYRGRVVFQDENDDESLCYFIVTQPEMASSREMPTIIGNQLFDFVAEWEVQDDALDLL